MPGLQRGPEGAPLPQGEWVLRIAVRERLPMDFPESRQVDPLVFQLSSADKKAKPPHLSVYAKKLTTPDQAWELMGARPRYSIAVWLKVDEVRELRPAPPSDEFPSLGVIWTQSVVLQDGVEVADTRPGAEGHAGIIRLDGPGLTKVQRSDLRSKLADLASKRVDFIPDALAVQDEGQNDW